MYVSSYYYMCILILLCMCPYATDENDCDMHVSTYYWMCFLVPPAYCYNVSSCYHYILSTYLSYYYVCVLIPDKHFFQRMQEEVEAIRTMNQRGIRIIAAGTSVCVSAA